MDERGSQALIAKAVLAMAVCTAAPHIGPYLVSTLGVGGLVATLGSIAPVSTLGSELGDVPEDLVKGVLGNWLGDHFKDRQQDRRTEANHHVSRILILAAATAIRQNEDVRAFSEDRQRRWAAELDRIADRPEELERLFAPLAVGITEGFWEEKLWPALKDGASMDAEFWWPIETALWQATDLANVNKPKVLEDIRPAVMDAMRRALIDHLLQEPEAWNKLDTYFKTSTARQLGDLTEQMGQLMRVVKQLDADTRARWVESVAAPGSVTPADLDVLRQAVSDRLKGVEAEVQGLRRDVQALRLELADRQERESEIAEQLAKTQVSLDEAIAGNRDLRELRGADRNRLSELQARLQAQESMLAKERSAREQVEAELADRLAKWEAIEPDSLIAESVALEAVKDFAAAQSVLEEGIDREAELRRNSTRREVRLRIRRAEVQLGQGYFEEAEQDLIWGLENADEETANGVSEFGLRGRIGCSPTPSTGRWRAPHDNWSRGRKRSLAKVDQKRRRNSTTWPGCKRRLTVSRKRSR